MGGSDSDIELGNETESLIPTSKAEGPLAKRTVKSNSEFEERKRTRTKRLRRKKQSAEHSPIVKYGSLCLLVAQLVGLVMLMRYSRTHSNGSDMYLSSTSVFCMEVMKFITCNAVVFGQQSMSPKAYAKEMYDNTWMAPFEILKVSVPSFLYVVQNNLLYLALSNLDAVTYQVCYQLKILTTALFSATMLNRKFSKTKWFSLIILTIGVAVVQTSGETKESTSTEDSDQNRTLGLFAILCAACTSGFSGVYFEKILKGSSTTLWMRNIQMGIPSMILALITVIIQDRSVIQEKGFFVGYYSLVWLVVIVQAVGGLIVAVVVKYADNVLKTFASSFGIVISSIVSAILFDFHPNFAFLVGSSLVILATVLYSKPDKKRRKRLHKSTLPR